MNRLAILAIVLVIVVGLVNINLIGPRPDHQPWIDPALEEQVDNWSRDIVTVGLHPDILLSCLDSIVVKELDQDKLGRAQARSVYVDPRAMANDLVLRGVVYHELGHGIFGLSHGSGIMDENAHSESEYEYYWPTWLKEYLEACRKRWHEHIST